MRPIDTTNFQAFPGASEVASSPADQKSGLAFACDTILALGADRSLPEILQAWAQVVVNDLNAAFARVWTVSATGPGLELQASAPRDTPIAGKYALVPAGGLLGHVASERRPYATNDLVNDPWLGDPEWAAQEGLVAFAGYPLMCRGELAGVSTVFSKQPLSDLTTQVLAMTAGTIALTIARNLSEAAREDTERELKARQTELMAANERYYLLVELAPNGILVIDHDGVITLANARAERMFGYGREELIGRQAKMLLPSHVAAVFTNPTARALGAEPDLVAVRKDGSEFPVEIGMDAIQAGGDMRCCIVDITERKAALDLRIRNAELTASGELYQLVIESVPNGILVVNQAGVITLANRQAEKMFGFPREELIGQPVETLLPVSLRGSHPGKGGAFFADPQARAMGAGRDLFAVRKDGSEFPVEIGLNPNSGRWRRFGALFHRGHHRP